MTDKALELEDQIKGRVTGFFGSVDMSSDEYKNAVKFIQDIAKKLEDNNKLLVEKTKF